jgi:hypothetical protein
MLFGVFFDACLLELKALDGQIKTIINGEKMKFFQVVNFIPAGQKKSPSGNGRAFGYAI